MKSYEWIGICARAGEQRQQENGRRKRSFHVIFICIVAGIALLVSIGFAGCASIIKKHVHYDIYPSAWKGLNAVIVKWGERNGKDRHEFGSRGETLTFAMDYIGIDVEFLKIYYDTMEESTIPNVNMTLKRTTYLLVPQHCLGEIKTGETALVFINRIATVTEQVPDETNQKTVTYILGVPFSEYIAPDQFGPSAIFPIVDGNVVVTEDACAIKPDSESYYYMSEMNYLVAGNRHIQKEQGTDAVIFKDGMRVEDLEDFFAFLCGVE